MFATKRKSRKKSKLTELLLKVKRFSFDFVFLQLYHYSFCGFESLMQYGAINHHAR